MIDTWEIWLGDPLGYRIAMIEPVLSVEIVKAVNDLWKWKIEIPGNFNFSLLRKDNIIEIWRSTGGVNKNLIVGPIRERRKFENEEGVDVIEISGPDRGGDLLKTRIVAYDAGSTYAEKTNQADDMMKDIIRENLGSSATDASRNLEAYGFSVSADISAGPSISKAFSRQNVLDALKAIASAAAEAGTDIYFLVTPQFLTTGSIGYKFETKVNQPGQDRSIELDSKVTFGKTWGNLAQPDLIYDDSEELTVVYCGGQGEGVNREVVEVENTARSGDSVWNRREGWIDARDATSTAILTARAQEQLYAARGRLRFTGVLLSVPGSIYGVDWDFGDRVAAEYDGIQFNGVIKAIKIQLNNDGSETIEAKLDIDQ